MVKKSRHVRKAYANDGRPRLYYVWEADAKLLKRPDQMDE